MTTRPRRGLARVTINDVAKSAKVSAQTVSRVINDRPDVAGPTRKLVKEVVEQLGYRPNASARALSSLRSRSVGVVAAKLDSYGPSTTLHGIERMANELGYSLVLELINEDFEHDQGAEALHHIVSLQVEGIIWMVPATEYNRSWLEANLATVDVPIVFVDAHTDSRGPFVAAHGSHGGRLATRHLVDCGYQRIGIITGPLTWASAAQRREGWFDVIGSAGPFAEFEGDWTAPSGVAGMRALLSAMPDLDGVFASNDQMALGALHYLHSRGIAVPDEVGVVGYDATPESEFYWPPLTTVAQALEEQGSEAVIALHRALEAPSQATKELGEPIAVWLQPSLIVRDTTRSGEAKRSEP